MTKFSAVGWPVMIVLGALPFVVPWLHALEQWVGLNFWDTSGIWAGLSMLIVMLGELFVPVLFVTGAVLLFFRAHRFHGIWLILCSFLTVLSVVGVMGATDEIRAHAFEKLAIRSRPVVAAIKEYETKAGKPPDGLESLVPAYLKAVPGTGLPMYPAYDYSPDSSTKPNTWELSVACRYGPINWDQFLYLPEQNYPKAGYGGWLERMGDWAYVHE